MRSYSPSFTRCPSTPPAARPVSSACQKIIDTMNADTDQITFGAQGVADVQVHLPLVLTDRESAPYLLFQCLAYVEKKKRIANAQPCLTHGKGFAAGANLVVYSDEHVRSSYRYHGAG